MGLLAAIGIAYSADDPIIEPSQRTDATFRLFRTQNIFNFLELDTRNGRVWQVQWNSDTDKRLVSPINPTRLAGSESKSGRFTLYPTSNIFTFMLLDQEKGFSWQIQWGLKPEDRLISTIEAWTEIAARDAMEEQAEKPATKPFPPVGSATKTTKPPVPAK
jgi:hypothetical protein